MRNLKFDLQIVTSVKRINNLTPNINNLPFQVCWGKIEYLNMKT